MPHLDQILNPVKIINGSKSKENLPLGMICADGVQENSANVCGDEFTTVDIADFFPAIDLLILLKL